MNFGGNEQINKETKTVNSTPEPAEIPISQNSTALMRIH